MGAEDFGGPPLSIAGARPDPAPSPNGSRRSPWRKVAWGAALLLLLPLAAMQVSDEVAWGPGDFALAGTLVVGVGLAFEGAARASRDRAYRVAAGVALATALALVWLNLAVGLIGAEDDPANLIHGGVLAVGLVGTLLARLRPRFMARALLATALAQAASAAVALAAGWGATTPGWPWDILVLDGIFTALWLLSAALFRHAARSQP